MIRPFLLCLLVFTHPLTAALEADDLIGFWKMEDQAVVIEIVQTTQGYEGVVLKTEKAPETHGKRMLKGLQFDATKKAWKGTMIALRRNKELEAELTLPNPDQIVMNASLGWFSTKTNWQRVTPESALSK